MEKKIKITQEKLFLMFQSDPVSEIMKWLIKNRIIRLADFGTKFGGYIPFDFRIDLGCSGSSINGIGEKLADRVIEIEKLLNIEFDSILCSLYGGIFCGIPTVLFLQQKYGRDLKIAVSRRTYIQVSGPDSAKLEKFLSSSHPLKNKLLVGELGDNVLLCDEMTNTGNTIKDLNIISKLHGVSPKAAMVICDRILEPMEPGCYVRIIDDLPCYSMITHFEIVEWCKNNNFVWQYLCDHTEADQNILYNQIKDNQDIV